MERGGWECRAALQSCRHCVCGVFVYMHMHMQRETHNYVFLCELCLCRGNKERKKENGEAKGGMGGRHAATTQGF